MQVFQKVVDEEGNETYVEVNLSEVELPEDHPVNVKLKGVLQESIERRQQLKALKAQLKELEAEEGETPEPEKPARKPQAETPEIDVETVTKTAAERAAELLRQRQEAEAQAATERETAIDNIMQETGLSATRRPVIEAIPDLKVARQIAEQLAKDDLAFGHTPSGGNGKRDTSNLLSKANQKLKLPEKP